MYIYIEAFYCLTNNKYNYNYMQLYFKALSTSELLHIF